MARSARIKGGQKLDAWIRKARKGKNAAVEVGFFASAKYPNGTPVAAVAAYNEFGTRRIPERPFLRNAIKSADAALVEIAARGIHARDFRLDEQTAGQMGAELVGEIQTSITTLRNPPNAPSTIRRKGSSNPLLDTGLMRSSVTWRIKI